MKTFIHISVLLGSMWASPLLYAIDFEVNQKNKKFSTNALAVKVGDTVGFKNDDHFAHNIFSLSKTQTFDLGSYMYGQTRSVTFDKPGQVEIECAIHPEMKMLIEVGK